MWTYDGAGNILSRKEYAYTTAATSSLTGGTTVNYVYGDSAWGDLLTSYNGQNIYTDDIGNMLSNEEWLYTWEHGRQLASMYEYNNDEYGWEFTYDVSGMRTGRTDGDDTYTYVYNGSRLSYMTFNDETLTFLYSATGTPMAVIYESNISSPDYFYYVTNIQGDVIAILNKYGQEVTTYTYDAWGNVTTTGSMAHSLGGINPLRYRGYVYDAETKLYYLQSRYYNPEIGRFINSDDVSCLGAGGSAISYNLFVYCGLNPAMLEQKVSVASNMFAEYMEAARICSELNRTFFLGFDTATLSNSPSWLRVKAFYIEGAVGIFSSMESLSFFNAEAGILTAKFSSPTFSNANLYGEVKTLNANANVGLGFSGKLAILSGLIGVQVGDAVTISIEGYVGAGFSFDLSNGIKFGIGFPIGWEVDIAFDWVELFGY